MNKEVKMIVVAVVLLAAAVALLARYVTTGGPAKLVPAPTAADVQKQITAIQNDPHMPDQAKAAAIGQIRAHMGQGATGSTGAGK